MIPVRLLERWIIGHGILLEGHNNIAIILVFLTMRQTEVVFHVLYRQFFMETQQSIQIGNVFLFPETHIVVLTLLIPPMSESRCYAATT